MQQFLGSVEPQKDEGVLSKQGDGNSLPEGPFECYRKLNDCRVVYISN
jgi:hypothetical protein